VSFQSLRDRLDAFGFRPRRRLGQNFLIDPNLVRAIADSLPLTRDSTVLEIGPGAGALTFELAKRAGVVVACEIDTRLVDFLTEALRDQPEGDRVRLVAADALGDGGLSEPCLTALAAADAFSRGWVCASNLPYSVAGPLLAALATAEVPPTEAVFLAQLEMAQRIVAAPGTREYGTLSVLLSLAWSPTLLRRIPRDVFRPRPRVESALVRLGSPGPLATRPATERRAFAAFLQALFGGRRKVLRNALARTWQTPPDAAFEAAALPVQWLTQRPSELAPEELWRVFNA
jgi:16S rRNA (adenine1518-N6/adenine1519-N6)-dimethyltransferase